jgi:hypothetical protein
MRKSEIGRWFRFLSVVSLMLCGFSINLWAANCSATSPCITALPSSFTIPVASGVTGTATFTATGSTNAPAGNVDYLWSYFDVTVNPSGAWLPVVPGPVTSGILQGATISLSLATNTQNTNPQVGVAAGDASTLTIQNVPAWANGVQFEVVVSDITSGQANSAIAPYNDNVVLNIGPTWSPDIANGGPPPSPIGLGPLPSSFETWERGALLAVTKTVANPPLVTIGGNNPETAGARVINIDGNPGLPTAPDVWTAALAQLPYGLLRPTVTLLPTGKGGDVLIAGGLNGLVDSPNAWVYTQGKPALTPVGALTNARDAAGATLLPTGLVLVTGGSSNGSILNSAELYDPATQLWHLAAPLNNARYEHTQTLLADGRVLVAGGFNAFGPITSAEVYDPIYNTWTPTLSPLLTARAYHTATLLTNGDVLIAGGLNSLGQPLASAEIFNPVTSNFVAAPSNLLLARDQHTATLTANGSVLIAGGFLGTNGATPESEYFSLTGTPSFATTAPLYDSRYNHGAWLVPDGDVIAVGGANQGSTLSEAEKFYDPAQPAAGVPAPSSAITITNNPVAGQYLVATCGNGAAGVTYAWTVLNGDTLLPVGGVSSYPLYGISGPNGIYGGNTEELAFLIPAGDQGQTLNLYCLATNTFGISSQSVAQSPNIAPGVPGGVVPVANINDVLAPPSEIGTSAGSTPGGAVTILQGGGVTFGENITAGAPTLYTYQWQSYLPSTGWVNLAGATGATLPITNAQTVLDSEKLQVLVTNAAGTGISTNQSLYVVATPVITSASVSPTTIVSPDNWTTGANGPATLTAAITPIPPQIGTSGPAANTISYRWCETPSLAGPTPVDCSGVGYHWIGAASASPTRTVNPIDGGLYYYYVVVTNTLNGVPNQVASPVVTLQVNSLPEVTVLNDGGVLNGPTNASEFPTVLQGNEITFTPGISPDGYPTIYTYQWQYFNPSKGWRPWGTGMTQQYLNAQPNADGLEVQVLVTNAAGVATSNQIGTNPFLSDPPTLYVVTQPTKVAVTLLNCPHPNPFTWTNAPIAQGQNACFVATDQYEPGNDTTYTWYEVGDNPLYGNVLGIPAPDLPLNTGNLINLNSLNPTNDGCTDQLAISPDTDTLEINHTCIRDTGIFYAVATNNNAGFLSNTVSTPTPVPGTSNPPVIGTSPTSNGVQLTVNVGNWSAVGNLDTPRFNALSLLLANTDDFFLASGEDIAGLPPLVTSDLYTSTSNTAGTWGLLGVSNDYHLNGTATLLGSGNVLLAGGSDGSGDGQTAFEIVNGSPYTISAAAFPVPTTDQVAGLLPNQSVLLAGGQDGTFSNFYNTAYLYTAGTSPSHDTLVKSKGTLSVARAGSVSVNLLGTGRILILGGQDASGPDNAVDIYDSSTTDENTTTYPTALYTISDSGLAGSGDFIAQAKRPSTYVAPAALVLPYTTASAKWTAAPTAALAWKRAYFTATQLGDGTGRILVIGGEDNSGNLVPAIEVWDPAVNSGAGGFYPLGTLTPGGVGAALAYPFPATLATPRLQHNAILLENGKVLVLGGVDKNGNVLNTAEIIDPNWVWSPAIPSASIPASNLINARTLASATLLPNGTVLAAGGWSGTAALNTAEVLNALEGYTTPTPTSVGTLQGTAWVPSAPWETITFTPAGGEAITNYSWSITPSAGTTINGGQGTPVFNFNTNANGTFTINLLVTDQYGISTQCTVQTVVTNPGWTINGPGNPVVYCP